MATPTPMDDRYPTPSTRWAPPNPSTPPCPSNPTHSPGTGAMNGTDRFMGPPSAREPRLTGDRVPPITPTTPKYFPGDSPKPHPKIGTPSPPPAPGLLPREPTTLTPPLLPLPSTTRSDTRALWHLPRHTLPPHP
ncbi:hypothetical protein C0992_011173 [Termitomyces sp. T32_za158]|nr:hypothetical protein C0992_011173 [Termitomyces sp. T32_za158]